MSPRTKGIIGTIATVLVLSGVFFVGWSLSTSKKPTTPPTIQLSPQALSSQAYTQGMQALSSEDTKTATALFQKAVTLNPANTAAKNMLDQLSKASSSGSSSSSSGSSSGSGSSSTGTKPTTTTTTKPAVDPFATKVADIRALVPKTFAGYSISPVSAIGGAKSTNAVVSGTPNSASAKASTVSWEVIDRETAATAQKFLTTNAKALYAHDAADVTVGGYPAYFGTNGTQLASVTVVRGRYVFVTTLTTQPGAAPATLKDLSVSAASAFPQAP